MIVEIFSVIAGILIFTVSIIARKFNQKSFLTTLGPGIFIVSLITFLHAVTYKGMGIIQGYNANLPTQFWIVINFILVISMVSSIWFSNKKVNYWFSLGIYSFTGVVATISCFLRIFPDCYIDGSGLTSFKKISEYIIIFIYLIAIVLLYKKKQEFDSITYRTMLIALSMYAVAEFMFTLYSDVYGIQNFLGHYIRLVSFFLIYITIVIEGIQKPHNNIFADLNGLSVRDGLTHLYNHRYFIEVLEKYVKQVAQNGKTLYLMMIDIDNFKAINDTYGHLFGDEVLIETAKIFKNNVRNLDIVSRQGGDEFSVIFYDAKEDIVYQIIQRIRDAFATIELTDKKITITLSGGVVKYSNGKAEDLIKRADKLLYEAKKDGRNKIKIQFK